MGGTTGYVMTLANSIIGVGILAMPFCFQKCGIILSIILLLMSNFITRLSCHFLLKCSLISRRRNFEFLAFHVFGTSGKLLVELCIIGYLIGTCIAYFVVVGDLGPQITAKLFNINVTDNLRTWVMIVLTVICVIPLGLLRNVDSLGIVCTASIGFYICLVIKVMAESKVSMSSDNWMDKLALWKPSGVLQCLPIFSMALSCQMQIFEVFRTMQNMSLEKLNETIKSATAICTGVYISVGFFGYVAFSSYDFSGNILLNFSQSLASDIMKVGFVLSVGFSFPLVIFPCRASLYSLIYRQGYVEAANYIPESRFKGITIFIVLCSLCFGILIPSIELVIGLVGSTIGVAICILFPACCSLKLCKKKSTERLAAQCMIVVGIFIMILGTYANLNAIDEKKSGVLIKIENAAAVDNLHDLNMELKKNMVAEGIAKLEKDNMPIIQLESKNSIKVVTKPPEVPLKTVEQAKLTKIPSSKAIETKYYAKQDTALDSATKKTVEEVKVGESAPVPLIKFNQNATGNLKIDKDKNNNINKDAIQKEEQEIALEQQKIETVEEIQELEKTKQLLEKQVQDIKIELIKQNEEVQKRVLEKIEEIAEKVVKIEQVQQEQIDIKDKDELEPAHKKNILKDVKNPTDDQPNEKLLTENQPSNQTELENIPAAVMHSNPLIKLLASNIQNVIAAEKKVPRIDDNKIFEPMSYKVGEILNKQDGKNNTILPLPLILLKPSKKSLPFPKKIDNILDDTPTYDNEIIDKKAIQSIRRDILELKKEEENLTTIDPHERNKRNIKVSDCEDPVQNELEL